MNATLITPGSTEWTSRLTCSRFWRLFSSQAAWRQLRREIENPEERNEFTAKQTEHGKENEPRARLLYEIERGVETTRCGFLIHPDEPRIGGTPDSIVEPNGMLEIKCPVVLGKHLLARQGQYSAEYGWQMHGGIWLASLVRALEGLPPIEWCDFVSFWEPPKWDPKARPLPPEQSLAVIRVERDDRKIRHLSETAGRFWQWMDGDAEVDPFSFINQRSGQPARLA